MSTTEIIHSAAAAGGTDANANTTTAIPAAAWSFWVARFITSTNRRVHVIHSSGLVEHGTNSTARAPTSMDRMQLGASAGSIVSNFWNGLLAEYWLANADIYASDQNIDTPLLRQIACGGPFSVPRIRENLVEYKSLRLGAADAVNECLYEKFGKPNWENINGAGIGHHPPLPYWYETPGQRRRALVI